MVERRTKSAAGDSGVVANGVLPQQNGFKDNIHVSSYDRGYTLFCHKGPISLKLKHIVHESKPAAPRRYQEKKKKRQQS